MKKLLLIALLNCVVVSAFAASVGAKWRWRNNDGTEKTATWKAGERQSITINNNKELRFRAQFYHEGNVSPILQYAEALIGDPPGIGKMITINDDPNTTNAFYIVKNNAYITHGEATTSQIPVTPSPYFPNPMVYGPGIMITKFDTVSFKITTGNLTELEWCIKPTKYVKGRRYYFNTNPRYTAWSQDAAENPILNISADYAIISPDTITRYSIKKQRHDIHMNWNTALQGHDHFEIEGRFDTAATFKRLATVPGGNVRYYQTVLKDAPKGLFHYRIKLFDKNGVMSTSRTAKFNNESGDTLLNFSLHPSTGSILFKWKTALKNHSHFILQKKSYASLPFVDIDTIPGGIGQNFSTTLPFNEAETVFLRMKLYDEDNRETISETKKFDLITHADVVKFEGKYNSTNGTMQFNFSTNSEYFNEKGYGFQIVKYELRPNDWVTTTLAIIKGQAWVQNKTTNYTASDNNVDGRYEIRYMLQYFYHGSFTQKQIIILAPPSAAALTFAIYPNPANSGKVSFDLKGYKGKSFTATLTNLQGKSISKETFSVNTSENYVLKANATSGTYILNISGEGITKTGKVLVQ